ncbi:hypothetical protein LTR28_007456 [Elasticomyces elasticus]|nr:hypothetical protein LTR28_007456 [Elasticomyces elasticus]
MTSATFAMLRLIFGSGGGGDVDGDPQRSPSMRLTEWSKRGVKSGNKGGPVEEVPASEEEDEGPSESVFGLGLKDCLEQHGMAWLPDARIRWSEKAVREEDCARALFRELLRARPLNGGDETANTRRNLHVAVELVVVQYVRDVFNLLTSRRRGRQDESTAKQVRDYTKRLTPEEAGGFKDLDKRIFSDLLQLGRARGQIRIAEARKGSRNGKGYFLEYEGGLWSAKVAGLFAWDGTRQPRKRDRNRLSAVAQGRVLP